MKILFLLPLVLCACATTPTPDLSELSDRITDVEHEIIKIETLMILGDLADPECVPIDGNGYYLCWGHK
jgi:hypothetical protein